MLDALTRNSRDMALVVGMILILIVLFSPIPPVLLDLAILANFGLCLTMLLLTFYVSKPVEFSTFPSLLLISTLLRLALNVAATRLILTSGYAGEVINSVGSFAVGGNYVVGLVVFFILVVVQYVVVTSGAQRVSEVAARFTLDSMPGQQMSIDADLNMGLIDQSEALRRRASLEKEASFYGAMDGASKFVKGDAIAGVIILLINIIAGWIIGVVQMGMEWNEALAHFTLLTIGDGIATQLPALIISTSTGIIVTRSSADKELGIEVLKQLTSVPQIPLLVVGMLGLILLLPGMPKWPLLILAGLGFLAWRQLQRARVDEAKAAAQEPASASAPNAAATLSVAFGTTLSEAWRSSEALLLERIAGLRDGHEKSFGIPFPAVQFVDGPGLAPQEYEIRIFGSGHARGEIEPTRTLAIKSERVSRRLDGIETTDPAFGLPAIWIQDADREDAREAGYTLVDPVTVFMTHFAELLREEAPALLTRAVVVKLVNDVRSRQSGLIEELAPTIIWHSRPRIMLEARPWLPEGALSAADFVARLKNRTNAWARRWLADTSTLDMSCDESGEMRLSPLDALMLSNTSCEIRIRIDRNGALDLARAMLGSKPKRRYPPPDQQVMLRLARIGLEDLLRDTAIFFGAPQAAADAAPPDDDRRRFLHFTTSSPDLPPISLNIEHGLAVAARISSLSTRGAPVKLEAKSAAIAGQAIRVGARLGVGHVSLSELYGLGQGDVLKIDRHEGPLPLTINGEAKRGVLCEPYREGPTLKLRLIEEHVHP
jgi:flagellar biosynthesis protein FlhA